MTESTDWKQVTSIATRVDQLEAENLTIAKELDKFDEVCKGIIRAQQLHAQAGMVMAQQGGETQDQILELIGTMRLLNMQQEGLNERLEKLEQRLDMLSYTTAAA
jgi:TolA-binding protein